MDCSICTLTYNDTLREKVECYSCGFISCKTCVRTYLMTNQSVPQCMNCGTQYTLHFMVRKLNRSWVLGKFKQVCKDNLVKKQKSLIPETMPFAEEEQEKRRYITKRNEIERQMAELSDQLRELRNESNAYIYLIRGVPIPEQYRKHIKDKITLPDHKKKFIMACGSLGCKGFLSTAYKCGLCNQHTCSDCLVVLGQTRDPGHVCNDNDKLSAELIKKETKPCPSCGERIYKVSGCDQMYCTQCHTAFSWKSGKIETGAIHNPHFYEIQRMGGTAIRNVGDVQCGGMPDIKCLLKIFDQLAIMIPDQVKEEHGFTKTRQHAIRSHRHLTELTAYDIDPCRARIRELSNTPRPILVSYILNDITEDDLGNAVYKNNRELQKNTDIYHVLELLSVSGIEAYLDIIHDLKDIERIVYGGIEANLMFLCDLNAKFEKLDKIRTYCNEQLKEISITYNCTTPRFDEDFAKFSTKYNISGTIANSSNASLEE